MRFQRCLEEPGTDYPVMRGCIPEESNTRLRVLRVVLDARLSLSIIITVTVLMTVDTTSLSPELLQTPLKKIAEFYSYVQVSSWSTLPVCVLCCWTKLTHTALLPLAEFYVRKDLSLWGTSDRLIPYGFSCCAPESCCTWRRQQSCRKILLRGKLKSGNIKRPKELPDPTDFCKRRPERINR